MCSAGRETTISGGTRATCHAHFNIFNDRFLGLLDTVVKSHSDASTVWCVLVYGRCIVERIAIIRSHFDHVHASQIPTRSHVLTTSTIETGSHFHNHSICLPSDSLVHQIVLLHIDFVSNHVGCYDWHSQIT